MSAPDNGDDWFGEPEPPQPAGGLPEEDWLFGAAPAPRAPRRAPFRELPRSRQISIGAGGIVVLLLVLWGVGAFGRGGSAPYKPPTLTEAAPTTIESTPAPAPVQLPATTLRPGSSGLEVKRLQRALARLGYSPGRIDGSYGPATENALKRFQQASGLQPDGLLGPKTLQALSTKLAAG